MLPPAAIVVSLLLLTGTLASWFAPFGWVAWGPRLMLPPLPAIMLIVLVVYAEEAERVLRRVFRSRVGTAVVAVVVIAVALPQVNVLHANGIVGALFSPDKVCPVTANVQADPSYYYHCLTNWAWARHWILLDSFRALGHEGGILFAIVFVAAWAWLLWLTGFLSAAWRRTP